MLLLFITKFFMKISAFKFMKVLNKVTYTSDSTEAYHINLVFVGFYHDFVFISLIKSLKVQMMRSYSVPPLFMIFVITSKSLHT